MERLNPPLSNDRCKGEQESRHSDSNDTQPIIYSANNGRGHYPADLEALSRLPVSLWPTPRPRTIESESNALVPEGTRPFPFSINALVNAEKITSEATYNCYGPIRNFSASTPVHLPYEQYTPAEVDAALIADFKGKGLELKTIPHYKSKLRKLSNELKNRTESPQSLTALLALKDKAEVNRILEELKRSFPPVATYFRALQAEWRESEAQQPSTTIPCGHELPTANRPTHS